MNCTTKLTIGIDLGDKNSELCSLASDGQVKSRTSVETSDTAMHAFFSKCKTPSKVVIVMEAGTHSPWLSDMLEQMGFGVLVANPRKLRAIWGSVNKSDRHDAEMLARLARSDEQLLSPITHRDSKAQRDLVLLKARDGLVRARTGIINQARGLVKSLGLRIPSCSAEAFPKIARENLPATILTSIRELLQSADNLSKQIRSAERKLKTIATKRYPQTQKLQQIKGVGPVTSLAYVLTIGNPARFAKSRDIGPYLGLVPRRDQSGETDKQLSITKCGNPMMRKLLVNVANHIMGPFNEDCNLRRHGERIAQRGGQIARRRAKVAVARKLAVLMHQLLISEEDYQPLYNNPASIAA